jgi:hypothetical protein
MESAYGGLSSYVGSEAERPLWGEGLGAASHPFQTLPKAAETVRKTIGYPTLLSYAFRADAAIAKHAVEEALQADKEHFTVEKFAAPILPGADQPQRQAPLAS